MFEPRAGASELSRRALGLALLGLSATAACGSRSALRGADERSVDSRAGAGGVLAGGTASGGAPDASGGARDASGGTRAQPTGGRSDNGATGGSAGMQATGSLGGGGQPGRPPLAAPDARRTPPTFCSIDHWCGSNANYVSIWGSSPFDIWIVAERAGDLEGSPRTPNSASRAALLHWNGLSWKASQFEGTTPLRSIGGSASDDVWLVGDYAFTTHFDGKAWNPALAPVTSPLTFNAVFGSSRSEAWAVGPRTILRFDGSEWRRIDVPEDDTFLSVWSSPAEVWVGGARSLRHFDRVDWVSAPEPSGRAINSVWGRGAGSVWVAGEAGLLASWNQRDWAAQQVAGQAEPVNYRALWGNAESDVWAVGDAGALAHWDGKSWSSGPRLTDSRLNAAWGTGGTTWVVGEHGTFLQLSDGAGVASPIAGHEVSRLWGSSANDVWAVGRDTMHWNGSLWTEFERPGPEEALAIWGSSASDVWVGCAKGTLLHWDGNGWSQLRSPSSADVNGVWGSARDDVWAVDSSGNFLHYDGAAWSTWPSQNFGPLQSVWGRHATDIVAVGEGRRVHFDGAAWAELPANPLERPNYRIAFGNAERVWSGGHVPWSAYKAGGAYPELGRWDGLTFIDNLEPTAVAPEGSPVLLSTSSIGAGWAATDDDVWLALPWIVHWDGQRWLYTATPGEAPTISALWGVSSDLWAVARPGQILHRSR